MKNTSLIKENNLQSLIVLVLEPASSPIISKGIKGNHTIDGISVGFVPPLLQKALYDEVQQLMKKKQEKQPDSWLKKKVFWLVLPLD